jgi:uncharacterized membrane protein YuzA (DUF378 family)
MDVIKRMEPVWLALVVVGAVVWGLIGLFDFNLVEEIFGSGTVADVVYVIVGIAGLMMVPRLLEDFRLGTHRPTRPGRSAPRATDRGCTPGPTPNPASFS